MIADTRGTKHSLISQLPQLTDASKCCDIAKALGTMSLRAGILSLMNRMESSAYDRGDCPQEGKEDK